MHMSDSTVLDAIGGEILPAKAKVLVVDDDEVIRTSLSQILEFGDFEVSKAGQLF
jgi:hypothetical protein